MKQAKILLVLGVWFTLIPLAGIPLSIKKVLLVIPALFLIAMAITKIRSEKNVHHTFSKNQEELIQEIAEDIAEDIVQESNLATQQELKKLRDIL